MTKLSYSLACLCLILAGCLPSTDLVRHGNQNLQFTQTYNQWADNIIAVTPCDVLDNGYCPKDAPTQIVVMPGKMPSLVGAGIQAGAVLGGSAIIAGGLKASKSTVTQKNSNRNDVRASTVNPK